MLILYMFSLFISYFRKQFNFDGKIPAGYPVSGF
jgi:hypothetical protein